MSLSDKEKTISPERLRSILSYDPETGNLSWIVRPSNRVSEGEQAGTIAKSGYRQISIGNRLYYGHRLAWLHMTGEWPSHQIDHANGIRSDNRWCNLRQATPTDNACNKRPCNGAVGLKGVVYVKATNRYRAMIRRGNDRIHLGYYDTPKEAHSAYASAADKLHGDFARAA